MSAPRAIGLGAGGHARVVIDAIRLSGAAEIVGLLDPRPELAGTPLDGVPILGGDELMEQLRRDGVTHVFVGLGGTTDLAARKRLFELAERAGYQFTPAIHPSAVIARSATIGRGVAIMANAVVNAGAVLGENVIVNTGAIVEHDCVIGSHAHIATGAKLAGAVEVGACAHLGIGCSVRQSISIGAGAIVGAGAVVIQNVPERTVVIGVPARAMRGTASARE